MGLKINEQEIQAFSEIITFNILNKTREYYGRKTRESNEFVNELQNDTKEYLKKLIETTN